ncbi:hypothetical protein LCGC14_0505430 [marine sediment metagenome]|uniref:Uncharacterized protein n=1 Tax=marine sediment metagenome TaxID=412755 RepID=A0A0F9VB58_9ZZZZ|nr:MAG: hypothetical protein Lokiarch_19810 [Candidatus Lokiarchaeum sp. GC14_75]
MGTRITVYNSTIEQLEKKSYEYEDKVVEYYLATLNNVEFGPQLKKKSDYKKKDIKIIEKSIARLSNTICEKLNLTIGDGISFNGGVVEDSFIGLMIKRATKVQKV